jgi:predicted nucleic acid-binding protein
MVYLDTNILIYASVEQDSLKREKSLDLIEKLINEQKLMLSTLVLQEFVFTMAKLKIDSKIIKEDSDFYSRFISCEYDYQTLQNAINTCCTISYCTNINDIIHLYLAQKSNCKKLITFDKRFNRLTTFSDIEIVLLD